MNPHRGIDSVPEDATLTAETALSISRRITRACFHASLASADAEDVAQDIWEWLLRTGNVALAQEIPWLGAVAQNYIKRFWRRSFRQSVRCSFPLDVFGRTPGATAPASSPCPP